MSQEKGHLNIDLMINKSMYIYELRTFKRKHGSNGI